MRGPLLLCLALLAACAGKDDRPTPEVILARGELVIGTEPEFPPFESKDEKGEFVGFDMDMARELAKDMGVKLRIEEMAFDNLPTALASGRIDVIVSGMSKTPEREQSFSFTEPYYRTELCLLVHVDSGIAKPSDADGKRIAVKTGTTGEIEARKHFPKAQLVPFPFEMSCALEVSTGRAHAFLYDRHSILRHHRNSPETTRVIHEALSSEPYAMAVRLGDTALLERLNSFLRAFRSDGRYDRIYETHFGEPPRPQ